MRMPSPTVPRRMPLVGEPRAAVPAAFSPMVFPATTLAADPSVIITPLPTITFPSPASSAPSPSTPRIAFALPWMKTA